MVERTPAIASSTRASGSTRGWQDRPSRRQATPGAFHPSVPSVPLAGVAVVPLPPRPAASGRDGAAAEDAPGPAPGGASATVVGTGRAGVVVVPATGRPARPDAAWARWIARTQAALHRTDAALACRWDAVWPDAAALVAWLRTRQSALARELEAVRGAVELVLHLSPDGDPGVPAAPAPVDESGPGRRWIARRRAVLAAAPEAAATRALEGPLAGVASAARRAVPDAMAGRPIVRLLVDHADVASVRRLAEPARRDGRVLRVAGPWVPGPAAAMSADAAACTA